MLTNTDLLRAIEMRTLGLRWGVDGSRGAPPPIVRTAPPSAIEPPPRAAPIHPVV